MNCKRIFLIYNRNEVEINNFSINKYIDCFKNYNLECILLDETNYNTQTEIPICVINRTNNYKIAIFFEGLGIRVFNNSKVSNICNNKLETYKYLGNSIRHLNIYDNDSNCPFPYIVKDPSSKGGKDVFLINDEVDVTRYLKPNMFKQQFLPNACDIRTYVIGNEIILSIKRIPNDSSFRANYKINHNAIVYSLTDDERDMVECIIEKFNFDYVGVDILKSSSGEFFFNEIEDSVGARAVYDLTNIDIIGKYVDYIFKEIYKARM